MTAPASTPLGVRLDRDLLLEASAGTGKTYALTTLAARLVVERRLPIEQLLIVTFTVAATGELRSRIWRTLRRALDQAQTPKTPGQAGSNQQARDLVERWLCLGTSRSRIVELLKQALRDFDRATITTIHGFCQRALHDFALHARTPFEFAVSGDDAQEVGNAVRDFWRRRMAEEPIPLLEFAAKETFAPVGNGWNNDNAVFWTMAHHAVPSVVRGAPDESASEITEEAVEAVRAALREHANRDAFEGMKKPDGWRTSRGKPLRDDAAIRAVEATMAPNGSELLAPHRAAFFSRDSLTKKRYKNSPPPDAELWDRMEDVAEAGEDWLAEKRRDLLDDARRSLHLHAWEDRSLSFNSLLVEFDRALGRENGPALAARVRKQFPVVLIDEFQDTDRLQARIFGAIRGDSAEPGKKPEAAPVGAKAERTGERAPEEAKAEGAAERGLLFIVGDPKQSIYRFRGADVFAYIEARERMSGQESLKLTRNYRSSPALLEAVNSLFERPRAFLVSDITFSPASAPTGHDPGSLELDDASRQGEAPLSIRHFPGPEEGKTWAKKKMEDEAAGRAAAEIAQLLELARNGRARIRRDGRERTLEAGDIAVLVRTGAQGRKVAEALREHGAKSVELGVDSVFESREARSLHRLLDALCADASEFDAGARLRGALAADLFGLDMTELHKLRDDDAFWETWSDRARNWAETWREKGVATFVREVLFTRPAAEESALASNLLRYPDGQRRLTNYLHLTDVLHEAETRERLSRRRLLDWFRGAMTDVTKGETAQLRLESDENLVKVVTVHRAKGLEFPIVFCPFAWHGQPPKNTKTASCYDPQSREPVLHLQPSEDILNRQKAEEYADELRLLYVALTRARYRCIVTWADANQAGWSAFAWLLGAAADGDTPVPGKGESGALAEEGDDAWKAVEANAMLINGLAKQNSHATLSALARRATDVIGIETVAPSPDPDDESADSSEPGAADRKNAEHGAAGRQRAQRAAGERESAERGPHAEPAPAEDGANEPRPAEPGLDEPKAETTPNGARTGPARALKRKLRLIRQRTSYSALAMEGGAAHSQIEHEQVERPDRDPDEPPADDPDLDDSPTPVETAPDAFTLPRGSRTGRWLHDIFERCLHPGADADAVCTDTFRRHHVPERWLDVTKQLVANTLDAPLAVPGAASAPFRLRDLDRPVAEMEFHLPVRGLRRRALRQVLLDHGYPTALPPTDAEIEGFLHGYIDLVARADDRWYVIDYKSNWLGPRESAYQGKHLHEAMSHSGYHLQYLLYLAALDRQLRLRLPGYDYDRHIGGAFYLFVRGVRPGLPGNGVFADRPTREAIRAINSCLGERTP